MAERALTKQEIIAQLTKTVHAGGVGKVKKGEKAPKLSAEAKIKARVERLMAYYPVASKAVQEDPEFYSKLVAWNHVKGSVNDAKAVLPAIALKFLSHDPEYKQNALAHIADLRPREFFRAVEFGRAIKGPQRELDRLVERYLRDLEADPLVWDRVAILHGDTLKKLYRLAHVQPAPYADATLFAGNPKHGAKALVDRDGKAVHLPRHEALKMLPNQSALEIAGTIMRLKIPLLVAKGVLGKKASEPDVLVALIGAMTPTQLTTNMTWLERLGVKTIPAARAALEKALEGAVKKGRGAALKATAAAEAVEDEQLRNKLTVLQEKQLDQMSIDGDWLVAGDKSGSMSHSIEKAREVAANLARLVKGRVHLIFFDYDPYYFDATGKTLEEITQQTKRMVSGGGTDISSTVRYLVDRGLTVDGIAVVSDGETMGSFTTRYKQLTEARGGKEPALYFYWVSGSGQPFEREVHQLGGQTFDVRSGVDAYALPNLIQTMRVGRYSLLDEVMAQDLKALDVVLDKTVGFKATCLPEKKRKRVRA